MTSLIQQAASTLARFGGRVKFDDWGGFIPVFAFVLIFGAFLLFFARAIIMKPGDRDHMASLPLDGDNEEIHS